MSLTDVKSALKGQTDLRFCGHSDMSRDAAALETRVAEAEQETWRESFLRLGFEVVLRGWVNFLLHSLTWANNGSNSLGSTP